MPGEDLEDIAPSVALEILAYYRCQNQGNWPELKSQVPGAVDGRAREVGAPKLFEA